MLSSYASNKDFTVLLLLHVGADVNRKSWQRKEYMEIETFDLCGAKSADE